MYVTIPRSFEPAWLGANEAIEQCLLHLQVLKQKAVRGPEKQPCLQQFQASEICDLPPRLRALFEDNKVCLSATA